MSNQEIINTKPEDIKNICNRPYNVEICKDKTLFAKKAKKDFNYDISTFLSKKGNPLDTYLDIWKIHSVKEFLHKINDLATLIRNIVLNTKYIRGISKEVNRRVENLIDEYTKMPNELKNILTDLRGITYYSTNTNYNIKLKIRGISYSFNGPQNLLHQLGVLWMNNNLKIKYYHILHCSSLIQLAYLKENIGPRMLERCLTYLQQRIY